MFEYDVSGKNRKSVDVIIPIYNAYEELKVCLESVYKNTDLETHRLILINDKSTDGRIVPFLGQQQGTNVIVIHNENNKGFSGSINIGMAQSDENDVILLNSDTVVTESWVEKMVECAYRESFIGTVTPLSNNATLCSVPLFCEENKLPDGITVEQAGKIAERCSMRKYPRITVANGFCMLIKREVIEAVGGFDAETFGRGYGEENDFCNRAGQAGYHHVMCDNTYIYHSGTKSFISKEKERYILQHDRILRERYPEQMHDNDVYVRKNPNRFVGENVGIYFDLSNGRKNVLYVTRSDFREDAEDSIGGTQFHVRDLMRGLRDRYNIFVAARNGHYLNLTVYFGENERAFRYYIGKKRNYYEFKDRTLENLWRTIISAFRIDVIHVHHVMNLTFDIFYVAREYGVPVYFTAHDFYFVCPSVIMLDADDRVCNGRYTPEKCSRCLGDRLGITGKIDYLRIWREKCTEVLSFCEKVIVPDGSVATVYKSIYPFIEKKLMVIEHGYDAEGKMESGTSCSIDVVCKYENVVKEGSAYKITGWAYLQENKHVVACNIYLYMQNVETGLTELVPAAQMERQDITVGHTKCKVGFSCVVPKKLLDGHALKIRVVLKRDSMLIYSMEVFETPKLNTKRNGLQVAFIGGLNKAKGGEAVADIVNSVKNGVDWYVFGGIGVKKLLYKKQDNLVKTGYYNPEDLPALLRLHEIDVIGILSIWPETYSYTLTEALLNHIPVIVTDIGALGSRVRKAGCGWIVSPEHIRDEFVAVIRDILKDRSILDRYRAKAEGVQIPDIVWMVENYQKLYETAWDRQAAYEIPDYEKIYNGYIGEDGGEDDMVLPEFHRELLEASSELQELKSSVSYKVIRRIWHMKIPGRNLAKKVLEKLQR